jgi:hypothetical protein
MNLNRLYKLIETERDKLSRCVDDTASQYKSAMKSAWAMADAYRQIFEADPSWLRDMVVSEYANSKHPFDDFLDARFRPLAIFGLHWSDVFRAQESCVSEDEWLSYGPVATFRQRNLGDNQTKNTPTKPGRKVVTPTQRQPDISDECWSSSEPDAVDWKARAEKAEKEVAKLRRENALLLKQIERLNGVVANAA